ncbi:MAG: hypothetical protein ACXVRG_10155, partial [Gaiellaceae bacterium]
MTLSLGQVYRDAWQVYRLLFRRSVTTAAIVFSPIGLLDWAGRQPASTGFRVLLGLVYFCASTAGPVIVQGALVEIVRNIHEGRRPERIGALYAESGRKFWSLLWASIVYGFGVIFGLIALIVPGLLAAARWCLMAPLIMLEGQDAGSARRRSSELVGGRTGAVLLIVVVNFIVLSAPAWTLWRASGWSLPALLAGQFVWNSLTAPFDAHVLTVIYYRLTDHIRQIVHPDV